MRVRRVVGDRLGQRASGDEAELGRQVLHQARHHVGDQDDPHQEEAVLRARADVGGDVAGVDVGDRGHERGPEQHHDGALRHLGVRDRQPAPFYPGMRIEKLG